MLYYSFETRGFYDTEIHTKDSIPKDSIEVSTSEYKAILTQQSRGFPIVKGDSGKPVSLPINMPIKEIVDERLWRDAELQRADVELYKVQDSDYKAFGSVSDWRSYRKNLRSWPEHKDFPNKDFRPAAPDV